MVPGPLPREPLAMPLATLEQYTQMLDAAASGGYALPAVNVTSSETLNAAIRGFAESGSDGIIQITVSAAEFLAGTAGGDALAGACAFAEFAHVIAGRAPILVALHTDHCPPEHVADLLEPLVHESELRARRGARPLFHSHMFDGSSLPLDENLRTSRGLLDRCARIGVVLEVECGVVGGEEDGIRGPDGPRDELYTTPADLLRVAEELGTGEHGRYLVAATFGNVHGVHAADVVQLRPEILRAGQEALAEHVAGRRFAYVFHGGSGSSVEELDAAIAYGVVKVNLDTEAQYAFTRAIAGHVLDHWDGVLKADGGIGDKRAYDPRSWGRAAESAMADRVRTACIQFGSAGRSLVA
jgi:fructose-bisphosphate aldolase class II